MFERGEVIDELGWFPYVIFGGCLVSAGWSICSALTDTFSTRLIGLPVDLTISSMPPSLLMRVIFPWKRVLKSILNYL